MGEPHYKPSNLNLNTISLSGQDSHLFMNEGSQPVGAGSDSKRSDFSSSQMRQMLSFRIERLKFQNNYRVAPGETIE